MCGRRRSLAMEMELRVGAGPLRALYTRNYSETIDNILAVYLWVGSGHKTSPRTGARQGCTCIFLVQLVISMHISGVTETVDTNAWCMCNLWHAVEWLKQFEGSSSKSVPLLVCLTFGDRLFVECQEDQGGYHPEHMKKAIATELKVTS